MLTRSGLGVGIAASTFASRGIPVDIVEIDPLVYTAARDHFGLQELPEGSVSLMDGVAYVRDRAEAIRTREKQRSTGSDDAGRHKEAGMADRTRDDGKWDLVVQDCFSGGMVPGELFTVEFWDDVKVGMKRDGVVAVVSTLPVPSCLYPIDVVSQTEASHTQGPRYMNRS